MRISDWSSDVCSSDLFSGGEPTARRDLEALVAAASEAGLYTNLITAGVLLSRERLAALAAAGLDHVQLSFQDSEAAGCDRNGAYRGGFEKKRAAAPLTVEAGLTPPPNNVHPLHNPSPRATVLDVPRPYDGSTP